MKGTIAFSGTSTRDNRPASGPNSLKLNIEYTIIGYEYNFIGKNVIYNLSFTTGVPFNL
jgi:hypothetical protein